MVSENNIIMKTRKEQSHCWHTLPVFSNQHLITSISLSWCLISTSKYNDINNACIFHVPLKSLSKTNYLFGPHNKPQQPVLQCIYYLLLHAAKNFINFLIFPYNCLISEVVMPLFFCVRCLYLHSHCSVPSWIKPDSPNVVRTRTAALKRHLAFSPVLPWWFILSK